MLLTTKWIVTIISDNLIRLELTDMNGVSQSLALNCSAKQFEDAYHNYNRGALIQDAFSFLSDSEREFIMTGMSDKDFQEMAETFVYGEN